MSKYKGAIISFIIIIILSSIYFFSRSEMIYTGVSENPTFIEVIKFILHAIF